MTVETLSKIRKHVEFEFGLSEVVRQKLIKNQRLETAKFAKVIIAFVAIPDMVISAWGDIGTSGFHLSWLFLRLGIVPLGALVIWSYRFRTVQKFPSAPLAPTAWYITACIVFFACQSGFYRSVYFPNYLSILMGLIVCPLTWISFNVIVGVVMSMFLSTLFFKGTFSLAVFNEKELAWIGSDVMLAYACFYVIKRLRFNLNLKTVQQEEIIQEQVEKISKLRIDEVIARAAQGLAHDVRRPFSMLKILTESLAIETDHKIAHETLLCSLPDINQAMAAVDGMIQDVMQIGSSGKLHLEIATVEEVIGNALTDVFRAQLLSENEFVYNFNHDSDLLVEKYRVSRVFSNVIGNAAQALNFKGSIYFQTSQVLEFVEFRIRNRGAFIAIEMREKMFESFYTSGKQGGTGLGLAIAKKIVVEHGGKILCESQDSIDIKEKYVEIVFTLPASSNVSKSPRLFLPKRSSDISNGLARKNLINPPTPPLQEDSREGKEASAKNLGGKFEIAYIDDTKMFTSAWRRKLRKDFDLETFSGSIEFCDFFRINQLDVSYFDLVFTDYYFDDIDPMNGRSLAVELRSRGYQNPVILASDGEFTKDAFKPEISLVIGKEVPSPQNIMGWHTEFTSQRVSQN